jgi:hypothetical protein
MAIPHLILTALQRGEPVKDNSRTVFNGFKIATNIDLHRK